MADDPPPLGDEGEIFLKYNAELRRKVARDIKTSKENIDDACGHAWVQFMRHQPDRTDDRHEAWLYVVARHEAMRLYREPRDREVPVEPERMDREVDPHDALQEREDFREAVAVLRRLPVRDGHVMFLRATGHTYNDIGEMTGKSAKVTGKIVRRAQERTHELLEERMIRLRPSVSPRADRLRDLERDPPRWLSDALGPRPGRRKARVDVRAWRRAALAIDDYRQAAGLGERDEALGPPPEDPKLAVAYEKARREHDHYRGLRGRRLGREL